MTEENRREEPLASSELKETLARLEARVELLSLAQSAARSWVPAHSDETMRGELVAIIQRVIDREVEITGEDRATVAKSVWHGLYRVHQQHHIIDLREHARRAGGGSILSHAQTLGHMRRLYLLAHSMYPAAARAAPKKTSEAELEGMRKKRQALLKAFK